MNVFLFLFSIVALVMSIISLTKKDTFETGKCVDSGNWDGSCSDAMEIHEKAAGDINGNVNSKCTVGLNGESNPDQCNYAIDRQCICIKDDTPPAPPPTPNKPHNIHPIFPPSHKKVPNLKPILPHNIHPIFPPSHKKVPNLKPILPNDFENKHKKAIVALCDVICTHDNNDAICSLCNKI